MIEYLIGFVIGIIMTALISYTVHLKITEKLRKELFECQIKINSLSDISELIKQNFYKIASETIKNEQEILHKQKREELENKIKPLNERLMEFQNKIDKFNITEAENTTKIVEQISLLERNNKSIEAQTKDLIEALTLNRNVKGEYGENLLENILNSCGMVENIHYTKQFVSVSANKTDDEIHTIRPDFIIKLPQGSNIIIDSKMTLTSYLNYVKNESLLKEFKTEVKKRITELSNKNYQNGENINSSDFVLMYIPIEACLNTIYQDYDLIDYAYKSNVIIIGTASLLTTLRLANYLIAQKTQSDNIKQIVTAGTNLYETFVKFSEELIDVQKKFEGLSAQLNKTINRFKRNNPQTPSLFSQIEELKSYGIHTSKTLPKELLIDNELMTKEEGVTVND